MFSWLGSFIAGPLLGQLTEAYKAKLAAQNDEDRIAAEAAAKDLEAQIAARQVAAQEVIAEQGRWYTAMIRPLFAIPFIIFTFKVVVWDKVLGWGVTDPLTGDVSVWGQAIIVAYFGSSTVERVARIIKRGSK